MAVIRVHYPSSPRDPAWAGNDDQLTGMLIELATVVGWSQGFEEEDREHFTWQINQVASVVAADSVSFDLRVTLCPDREIPPPFAGIVTCLEGLLQQLGHGTPTAFTVEMDPFEARLRPPEGMRIFRTLPAATSQQATLSVLVARGSAEPVDPLPAMTDLLDGTEYLLGPRHPVAAPVCIPTADMRTHDAQPPTALGTVETTLPTWGAVSAGALANAVMWNVQDLGLRTPVTVHVSRTRPTRSASAPRTV